MKGYQYVKPFAMTAFVTFSLFLTACSSTTTAKITKAKHNTTTQAKYSEDNGVENGSTIARLQAHHKVWKNTPYRLGGTTKKGIDCSAFTQVTLSEVFGVKLPRTTTLQAEKGKKVARNALKAGDLIFFKTGRGPNGKHVGVYVKDDQFMHASTKGGVIYSSLNTPYWKKVYWQARRYQ